MPYRRLPNTDKSRLEALRQILVANRNIEIFNSDEIRRINDTVREFEILLEEYNQTKQRYKKQTTEFNETFKMAKLYLQHFVQVFLMAITRKEISESYKKIYDIENFKKNKKNITNTTKLKEWYKKISDAEHKRISQGGKAMSNPTLGEVNFYIEKCSENEIFLQQLKNKYKKDQENLKKFRKKIDKEIKDYWDKIEKYFEKYPTIIKIEKTKKFGLRYFFRSSEDKIELKDLLK